MNEPTNKSGVYPKPFVILVSLAVLAFMATASIAQSPEEQRLGNFMEQQAIVTFWYGLEPAQWFKKSTELDDTIKEKFGDQVASAIVEPPLEWREAPQGALALILMLDQFTRHIYRGTAQMYAGDETALETSLFVAEQNWLKDLSTPEAMFALMPMMHSEDLEIQRKSIPLFKKYTSKDTVSYAERHQAIIQGFGRFPHRNEILERESTESEVAFLLESPNNSF